MLLIIDNRPLQRAAWAEFHAARRRLEKVSADLHRHEEVDLPAYESWVHRTFPLLITTLRQLHEEVFIKGTKVRAVEEMSYYTGRSLKKLWRELKEREANPEAFEDDEPEEDEEAEDFDQDAEADWDDLFEKKEEEDESAGKNGRRSFRDKGSDLPSARSAARGATAGKDVYRRLVQRLHPDRGGEWTAVRQRLWHEVQQAWANGDVDWLIRLEVEWESANDVLGPTSPVGRLRLAIEELHAARRDIERKLRDYRGSPAWRFTLSEKNRAVLHRRTEENFRHDLGFLRRQLDYLNATIAAWERAPRSSLRPKAAPSGGSRGNGKPSQVPRRG